MPPEVLESMAVASKAFVDMNLLLKKAGQRIAQLAGAEAAYVTSGAAAGLSISAATCMAGTDRARIEQLPNTEGMKNEIVTLKCHRLHFDQAIRQAGAKLREVGYVRRSSPSQLEHAIGDRTAAVFYLPESATLSGSVPLDEVIQVAKAAGVPVIVDAAAELPPVSNLHAFTDMGADLVIFSGGKDIRGPQGSGFILGRQELIEACALNGCPNQSIGRPMKVDKESVVGLVRALEIYVEQDFDREMKTWEEQVAYLVKHMSKMPYVAVRRGVPLQLGIRPSCIPRAYVDIDESGLGMKVEDVVRSLREGSPGVIVGQSPTGIIINPHMLDPGEETTVLDKIRGILVLASQRSK